MNTKTITRIEEIVFLGMIIILPTFVLTSFIDVFNTPKLFLLIYSTLGILILKLVKVALSGKVQINRGSFDLPLLILALSFLVSGLTSPLNKADAFLFPGSASIIISAVLIYFFSNQIDSKKKVEAALFSSAIVLSIFVLLGQTGLFENFTNLPEIIKLPSFSPIGGLLPTAIFLAAILPLTFDILANQKEKSTKVLTLVAASTILFALATSLRIFFPASGLEPALLDFDSSWNIAVDTVKERPLTGFGPGGYINAFNKLKPLEFNQTEFWNLKFNTARSFYLTVITETGILGLIAVFFLLSSSFKKIKEKIKREKYSGRMVSLMIVLTLLIVFPATSTIIVLLALLLSLNTQTTPTKIDLNNANSSKIPSLMTTLPLIVLCFYLGFILSSAVMAEGKFSRSLDNLSEGKISESYDGIREVINASPEVDRYHVTYSRINIALAESLASKEGLTEDERASITSLIQQAIREAKIAVSINTNKSSNWENLANVYRSIMSFAEGADQFTIQTHSQAIALDPLNPNLRITLGGVYYSLGNYEKAIETLKLAVATKPDLANSHYNLALAYKENGNVKDSINQMSIVLSLLDKTSSDYQKAKQDLQILEGEIVQEEEIETNDLVAPPEDQEQLIAPPIEIDQEPLAPDS